MNKPSIYDIKLDRINGDVIDLADYRGRKILIVNVASDCGFTPQYRELQEIYEALDGKMEIIGLPCNDFGGQEPGTEEEISNDCLLEYMVTFPVSRKVNILTKPVHPLYQWLCQASHNGQADYKVEWNFYKFLIDEQGRIVAMYPSSVSPSDGRIVNWAVDGSTEMSIG